MNFFIFFVAFVTIILVISYATYRIGFYISSKEKIRLNPFSKISEGSKPAKEIKSSNLKEFTDTEKPSKDFSDFFELINYILQLPYEAVSITSHDGLHLMGKYYHVQKGAPLQIQMHGYRGSGARDFCGGTKLARNSGHNVLVIDERSHGGSDGHTITMGIKERYDCLDWISYANKRFGTDTKILLVGLSMGSATVLMASELELPPNVVGIIADCPYSSPKEIVKRVAKGMHFPPNLAYPFIRLGALIFGHFNIEESDAVSAVKNAKIPILLIHGEADSFVPCEMSRKIYEACEAPKMLETFPGAEHGMSYMSDIPRYRQVIKNFFKLCGLQTNE